MPAKLVPILEQPTQEQLQAMLLAMTVIFLMVPEAVTFLAI
jgi:hypothetical protein